MPTEYDLIQSGRLGFVEVIDGDIVTLSPNSYRQNLVADNIYKQLQPYTAHGVWLRGHMSYVLHRHDEQIQTLRLPDVSYMRQMPDFDQQAVLPAAPQLAVKVTATYDSAAQLEACVTDYLSAGTQQVWLLYAEQEELHQYTPAAMRRYPRDEIITVTDIFPLRVRLPVRMCFVYPWSSGTTKPDTAT